MKKLTFIAAFFMLFQVAFAGGLLTNTNQSAQFIRMMSRNASTDIDAVYFNPAGLIHLEDGWHFAFHSQTIFQTKTIDSKFPLLNDGVYEGVVNVPVFPSGYGVYKEDNWAFSLGFGPNAGGGSATFDRGLPSFEIPISKLGAGLKTIAPLFQQYPIPGVIGETGYNADLTFEGNSVFWGIQLGATYLVNDILSLYGGVRVLPSSNSYYGEIRDIEVETEDGYISGEAYLGQIRPILTGTIETLQTSSSSLEAAIEAGMIDPTATVADPQIVQTLSALGYSNVTYQQAIGIMDQTAESLQGLSNADVGNKKVDTEQTGIGFTPMIGVEIAPNENWNIALKYEMKTNLELTNKTVIDDLDLFPDGAPSRNDLPAILAAGVGYRNDRLEAQLSYNMYFNKGVGWGPNTQDKAVWENVDPTQIRNREIDRNGMEVGLGLQYNVTDEFAFSVGGLWGDQGVADSYQSDFSYSNPSVTAGAGIEWLITNQLILDAGFSNTFYQDQTVSFTDPDVGSYKQTMGKTTMTFAVGLSYAIF